jgi:hypothetical protein
MILSKCCFECDVAIEQFRDRAVCLSIFCTCKELLCSDTRNGSGYFEIAGGYGTTVQRYSAGSFDLVRCETGCAQHKRQLHREAACMRGSYQFFGVGTNTFLKAAFIRILSVCEGSALCRQLTISLFTRAVPNGSCIAFHVVIFIVANIDLRQLCPH